MAVLQPPPIQGLSSTGGFDFMIEDREGKGVEAHGRRSPTGSSTRPGSGPSWPGSSPPSRRGCPSSASTSTAIKARRLDVPVSDVFSVLQTNLGAYYVNDFNLYGKTWKVMVQAEGRDRHRPEDIARLYVLNRKGEKVPLSALGQVKYVARADRRAALQHVQRRQDHRPARPGLQLGPGDRRDGGGGRRGPARGVRLRVDRHDLPGAEDRQHGDVHLRPVDRLRLPVHGGPLRELDPARWSSS